MITHITEEQANQCREIRKKWTDCALSTAPADRDLFEKNIDLAYRQINLDAPDVRWVASPVKGIIQAALAVNKNTLTIKDELFGKQISRFNTEVENSTNELERDASISSEIFSVLTRELNEKLFALTKDIVFAITTELDIRTYVIGMSRPRTSMILQKLVSRAVHSPNEAGNFALFEVLSRVLGIINDETYDLVRGLSAASLCAGWYWPFERFVIACERPVKIHLDDEKKPHNTTGSAIEFSDGLSIFCHHGVRIPPEAISGGVDWSTVQSTTDKTVKEAIAEMKAETWSREGAKTDQTAEERQEAAAAVRRLGGLTSLQDLTESEET